MIKYSFKNDYSEGAHPQILKALSDSNFTQQNGYSEDDYCQKAKQLIKGRIENTHADIHFVSGGTQANLIMISTILKPYQAVIAAETGHIAVHETGAIEATGHKVITVKTDNGKLSPKDIIPVLNSHTDEHMVFPKLVYISNSTEIGSIYNKKELSELSEFCKQNQLYLILDGARLASALTSEANDLSLSDISKMVDIYYIGGTKNGALLGEAIVIIHDAFKEHFRFTMKQRGALLAKGRILGVQFLELFKENLFFDLGKHANQMATKLADGIKALGFDFLTPPVSNQIFPILPQSIIQILSKSYAFYEWEKINEKYSAIRLVSSWATPNEMVKAFLEDLNKIKK